MRRDLPFRRSAPRARAAGGRTSEANILPVRALATRRSEPTGPATGASPDDGTCHGRTGTPASRRRASAERTGDRPAAAMSAGRARSALPRALRPGRRGGLAAMSLSRSASARSRRRSDQRVAHASGRPRAPARAAPAGGRGPQEPRVLVRRVAPRPEVQSAGRTPASPSGVTSSKGRRSPRSRAMPDSASIPPPRHGHISTVSAWSSTVCPTAARVAPVSRVHRRDRPVAGLARPRLDGLAPRGPDVAAAQMERQRPSRAACRRA